MGGRGMSDYEDMYIQDAYMDDGVIWAIREKLDPPEKGYVMFSSSGWEENVEHLVEVMGVDKDDIYLVRYGDYVSCWIPEEQA